MKNNIKKMQLGLKRWRKDRDEERERASRSWERNIFRPANKGAKDILRSFAPIPENLTIRELKKLITRFKVEEQVYNGVVDRLEDELDLREEMKKTCECGHKGNKHKFSKVYGGLERCTVRNCKCRDFYPTLGD